MSAAEPTHIDRGVQFVGKISRGDLNWWSKGISNRLPHITGLRDNINE
jgi:hypothetical protein